MSPDDDTQVRWWRPGELSLSSGDSMFARKLVLALLAFQIAAVLPLLGAQVPQAARAPRFIIHTRADFELALKYLNAGEEEFPRAAIIAQEGRRIVPWALDILTDEQETMHNRLAVLAIMRYMRDSTAVRTMIRLARPITQFANFVMAYLVTFPQGEVCRFWHEVLEDPVIDYSRRRLALRGISFCGTAEDVELLVRIRDTPTVRYESFDAKRAVERLQKRLTGTPDSTSYFYGPPPPDGRYVPSPWIAEKIRRAVCGRGPCQASYPVTAPVTPIRN